jgi:hypothetical protein
MFATISHPSYTGVPVLGLFVWFCFALTAAAGLGAGAWMRAQDEELAIPGMDWWKLAIAACLAVLLLGSLQIGPVLTLPFSVVALGTTLFLFTRARDKRVPPVKRILTKDFAKNMVTGIRNLRAQPKGNAAGPAAKPLTLSQRLKAVGDKLQQSVSRTKKSAPEPPAFMLLKKDGRPAFASALDGSDDAGSDNVRAAQQMLIAAMKRGATDIHFEPHEKEYHVRYRVDGVLQDIHWSAGYFGYFPSYTLGNLYAASLDAGMRAELPGIDAAVRGGELGAVLGWLRSRVHARGATADADSVVRAAVGPRDPVEDLLQHLRGRFAPAP